MKIVNLKNLYPNEYKADTYTAISDDIYNILEDSRKQEEAQNRKQRYHKVYSLDIMNGHEKNILFAAVAPDELYERKLSYQQLYAAIASLPPVQARRITARYILEMTIKEIAIAENAQMSGISRSIQKALHNLEKILKKSC